MKSIDLNCDLGEGSVNDELLMPLITSANIACGGHAGNEATMRNAVRLAIQFGVCIGAHPGYADRANFGRIDVPLPAGEVEHLVKEQVSVLARICRDEGAVLRHVKPHGALYNAAARQPSVADAIATAVATVDHQITLVGLAGSELLRAADRAGLKSASEVFADRTYQRDGTLTPRSRPDALINDPRRATEQVLQMLDDGFVLATDGTRVPIKADTICIHGDGPHAVEFALAIRQSLLAHGVTVRAFVPSE